MAYFIIRLVLFGGIVFSLKNCNNKQKPQKYEHLNSQTGGTVKIRYVLDNQYQALRSLALNMRAEQLPITLPIDKLKVYGVVMDWDLGDGIATFIAFSTGDAGMYLSRGGGLDGEGQHENVSIVAKVFVDKAQLYLSKTNKIDSTPLPDKNCVRFYFMTNNGRYTAQEDLINFENSTSIWLPLFNEGNKVITELRVIQKKK